MGTNYYLHLGKRTSQGQDMGCRFTWAIEPHQLTNPGSPVDLSSVTVQDEYGQEMPLAAFLQLVSNDTDDLRSLGQVFS